MNPSLEIVHSDPDLLVVSKPPGLLSTRAPGRPADRCVPAILRRMLEASGEPCELHLLHRLDEETSGLLALARNERARTLFEPLFRKHRCERVYQGLVIGSPRPERGVLLSRLAENGGQIVRCVEEGRGRRAVTRYAVLEEGRNVSLVAFRLSTGRRNQIRVQMASVGHPILGDRKYGKGKRMPFRVGRAMLHAFGLALRHPLLRKEISLTLPPPRDFREAMAKAGIAK